jgi:photosystem II stability/assembly factor-like uncharacterized protein
VIDDSGAVEERLTVVGSDDAGESWRTSRPFVTGSITDRCGPDAGCRLAIAPTDPDRLYLALSAPVWLAGGPDVVHVSDDGGRTWQQRRYPYDLVSGGLCCDHARDIAVDPADPDRVWMSIQGEGLFRSDDGARTWTAEADVEALRTNPLALLDAGIDDRGRTVITTFDPAGAGVEHLRVQSRDGGASWHASTARSLGTGLRSIAHGAHADDVVVASDEGVYAYAAHADVWVDVNVLGLPSLDDVQADVAAIPSYYLRNDDVIAWFTPEDLPTVSVPLRPQPDLSVPDLQPSDPVRFLPASQRVVLEPGESTTVSYRLDLPAQPTPLDVFFLLDASGSMGDDHRSLARQLAAIVGELSRARIPVAFGLGTYRDLDERYRRLHDIAPPSPELVRKLYAIRAAGGTEPAYTALRQMATGSGVSVPVTGSPVAAGQQGSFRDGARRFVVHVTDEPLQPDPPHGDPASALLDLRTAGIGHIGLSAQPPTDLPAADAVLIDPQLRALAAGTGALAPPGGVDCDGDGRPDLGEGDPIVCRIPDGQGRPDLATPLLEILLGLEDRQGLRVVTSDPEIVPAIEIALDGSDIDVTKHHVLGVDVTARCPLARVGDEVAVDLVATLGDREVARGAVVVNCGASPDPAAAVPGPPEPPLGSSAPVAGPALALGVPALPPPIPVPATGSAISSSPASSGASAGAAAGSAAAQPGSTTAASDDDEHASARSSRLVGADAGGVDAPLLARRHAIDPSAAFVRAAGALVVTAMAATFLRSSTSTRRPGLLHSTRRRRR